MDKNTPSEIIRCSPESDVILQLEMQDNRYTSFSAPSIRETVWSYYKMGNVRAIMSLLSSSISEDDEDEDDAENSDGVGGDRDDDYGESDDVIIPRPNTQWDPLLLWVRPSLCCLQFLGAVVREAGINALASVGCGTGLLEWLVHATTGLSVMGYEVNGDWWNSKYSPPTFIPLTYVDPKTDPPAVPCTHALMCCYFNNGEVFRSYVDAYDGPLLIIIGSVRSKHFQHTEPRPLDYVDVHPWTLKHKHNITETDVIACYIRDPWKVAVAARLGMCRRFIRK